MYVDLRNKLSSRSSSDVKLLLVSCQSLRAEGGCVNSLSTAIYLLHPLMMLLPEWPLWKANEKSVSTYLATLCCLAPITI
jgi:hypothetical protein